jgi:hypothetical protein
MLELPDDCDLPELLVYLDYLQEFSRYPDEVIEATRRMVHERCWPVTSSSYLYQGRQIPAGFVWGLSVSGMTYCRTLTGDPIFDASRIWSGVIAIALWVCLDQSQECFSTGDGPGQFKTYLSIADAWRALLRAQNRLQQQLSHNRATKESRA